MPTEDKTIHGTDTAIFMGILPTPETHPTLNQIYQEYMDGEVLPDEHTHTTDHALVLVNTLTGDVISLNLTDLLDLLNQANDALPDMSALVDPQIIESHPNWQQQLSARGTAYEMRGPLGD